MAPLMEGARHMAKQRFQREALKSSAKRSDGLVVAAYLNVRKDGRMVQLHLPGVTPAEMPSRGDVEGFSDDSRRRLMELLHSIRRDAALPVMVTLTFPAEIKVSPREAKQCRIAWEMRMRRTYGSRWSNLWRLEAHPKMSERLGRVHPHFHLLTWGAFYDFADVSKSWQEAVWRVLKLDKSLCDAAGRLVAEKHREAGTNCERIRCWGGVLYSGKNYIAKEEGYPLGKAGRVWGWSNRKALPLAEETVIRLTAAQAMTVRANVEDWMRAKRIVSEHLVCTFFDDEPSAFAERLLLRMPVAKPPNRMPTPAFRRGRENPLARRAIDL